MAAKSGFDQLCEERKDLIQTASAGLEYAFTFMEDAFGEGQEMVIFVTELTMDPEISAFITENGCERYFKYNKSLLIGSRRLNNSLGGRLHLRHFRVRKLLHAEVVVLL